MGLSYQDVYFIPEYSEHRSRSGIDTTTALGHQSFRVPIVPANMACTINVELARWMSQNNYFYIMHRFGTKPESVTPEQCAQDTYEFVKKANVQPWKTISISVGVQEHDKKLLTRIAEEHLIVDYITIDIAHAHSIRMKEMLEFIQTLTFKSVWSLSRKGLTSVPLEYRPFIIAGNVATGEAVADLEQWGAHCVKVGIAQGGACTTYGQTGFGVPMFSCMIDCVRSAARPLIADGGIKDNGDFAKALAAGGHFVMAGSKFACSIDSPAETIVKHFKTGEVVPTNIVTANGSTMKYEDKIVTKTFKRYYGSASIHNKHNDSHVEGTLIELECDGTTYAQKLKYLEGHLQSSISYAGGSASGGNIKNRCWARWGIKGTQGQLYAP